MKRVLTLALTACLALTVGIPASAAKKPVPPTVTTPASRTIPWYECHDASDWVHWQNTRTGKGVSIWVTIRKPGYTQPIKGGRICGYMGSGTYNLRIRIDWEKRKKVTVRKPVYRWKTVQKPDPMNATWVPPVYEDWPFTCTLTGYPPNMSPENNWGYASYSCAFDNGREWQDFYDTGKGLYPTDQTGCELYFPDDTNLATGYCQTKMTPMPPTLTGRAEDILLADGYFVPAYTTVEKRYIHHYRNVRVTKWVEARSFYVNRSIQVTVR